MSRLNNHQVVQWVSGIGIVVVDESTGQEITIFDNDIPQFLTLVAGLNLRATR